MIAYAVPECFFLNSEMALLKAGSDFAAFRASIKSVHSGVSVSGFRRFIGAAITGVRVILTDFCIVVSRLHLRRIIFINLSHRVMNY